MPYQEAIFSRITAQPTEMGAKPVQQTLHLGLVYQSQTKQHCITHRSCSKPHASLAHNTAETIIQAIGQIQLSLPMCCVDIYIYVLRKDDRVLSARNLLLKSSGFILGRFGQLRDADLYRRPTHKKVILDLGFDLAHNLQIIWTPFLRAPGNVNFFTI